MLSNNFPLFYTPFLLFFILSTSGFSQKTDISSEPPWILILPGTISELDEQSRENSITDMVVDIAWETGRFEVFDRFDVQELLKKYQFESYRYLPDSLVLAIGNDTECDEALLVDLLSFSQIGMPPVEDEEGEEDQNFIESIFDGLFSSEAEDYSDNILTSIRVQFREIDLITGTEIDCFEVKISHTGGTKLESEEEALQNFRETLLNELRMIYQLVSEVIAVDGLDLQLRVGSNFGLSGNTLFEIYEPNRVINKGDEKITSPGKSVGLAYVQSVGDTVNRSHVIRQWEAIEPGYFATEFNKNIYGFQVFFLPKFPGDYLYFGGKFHYNPLGIWDFGGGIYYTNVTDSYNESDHGFGFGIFGSLRLITATALMSRINLGADLDIPFKKDDDGVTVTTGVLSGTLGISVCLMITKMSDIELNFGYRLSTKSSNWSYNEDEKEFDAFWYDEPPSVDLSGIYFTLGYKYILF